MIFKKLIYLASLVLVLCSFQIRIANADDPSLVGWWRFDEGSGTIAYDSSGHGNDGTFNGDPQWVSGHSGHALEFDGSGDWLDCGEDPSFQITDAVTVSAWIKVFARGIDHKIAGNQDDANGGYKMSIFNNRVEFEIRTSGNIPFLNRDVNGGTVLQQYVWYHVAGVYSQKGNYIRTYVDGNLDRELVTAQALGASLGSFKIGCEPFMTGLLSFIGVMDDLRIYNRALTQAEILAVMEGYIGEANPNASRPKPADGALLSDIGVNLSWAPGIYAVSHDVYFGDNFDDVNDNTGDTFQGNQTAIQFRVGSYRRYPFAPDLVAGTTYYWRIDEVNDTEPNSPWKGEVWNFMTPSETASGPYPADGANFFVDPNVVLRWTAGFGANWHQVYFGDNLANVSDADTSDTTGIYRGTQAATTYTPGPLRLDSPYYWRVDEVTAGRGSKTHKGNVWSFTTAPQIAITDPNLLCWWMFNEAEGTTAIDYSGHNHYGIVNGATWVANGRVGGALDFGSDGDYVLDEDAENYLNGLDALTVCMWIKSNVTNTDKGFLICKEPDLNDNVITMRYDSAGLYGGGAHLLKMAVMSTGGQQQLESSNNLQTTEWQHVAMTWSSGQALKFYVNGVLDSPTANDAGAVGTLSGNVKLIIGKGGRDVGPSAGWDGLIDDVRIYNIALSDAEIYALGAPLGASRPDPGDGALYEGTSVSLSWVPGIYAVSHDVYFGDNFDDVNDSTADTFRGKQIEPYFLVGLPGHPYPEGLVPGTTYYWRVDEIGADGITIYKGNVWSLSILPKTAYTPKHFDITYYDNYNYDTNQWDAWQSAATPRDAWDDKYLVDSSSGNTVYTDHAFTSITEFDLRGGLFSKDGHASGGNDWNPVQSIGDNISGQSAHHVFAALFRGMIYLEEGDNLRVASDDDVYVFLDGETAWGQEILSVPFISQFSSDSMTVTAAQAGYHMMTVNYIERRNIHSGIEITLNGKHIRSAEVPVFEDFEGGDFSKLSWRHSGDSNWTISQREKHWGAYSAQAGTIGDDEYTTLEMTLDCVSGDISFYRKVSSEFGFDYLKFNIDGIKKGAWSGEEDWAEVSFPVDEGMRTFEWTYSKDDSISGGDDTAWIDDIVFPLKSTQPVGPNPSNGFDLYEDDIAPNITASNYITSGILDYYSQDNPAFGDYCIHWTGADLWNMISFRFSPFRDLSVLVDEGYVIDFWIRCDSPNTKILIRFMDTNTDDTDNHPWRIVYPIDRNIAVWDGRWNHLQIPLNDFYEQGSWDFDDDHWYDPVGAFDWTAIEYFEIMAEYSDLEGIHLYFDDIRVVDPNPPDRF